MANTGYVLKDTYGNEVGVTKYYAEGYAYSNSTATTITAADVVHPTICVTAGQTSGVTLETGATGTAESIATYAEGAKIQITDTGHGLTTGQVVILVGGTQGYAGVYLVEEAAENTFVVTKAYVADDTPTWYRPCVFKIPAGGAGVYELEFACSGDSAANNKIFEFDGYVNTTKKENIAARINYAVGADWGVVGMQGLLSLTAGDYVWIGMEGKTDDTNFTIRHENITLNKVN